MGVNRYLGGVISADPNTPTVESASGTWTLEEAYQNIGNWPMAQSQIQNSLRFNSADSASLSRTPSVASNRRTWTWSGWVKRSNDTTTNSLFSAYVDANNFFLIQFRENADNGRFEVFNYSSAYDFRVETNALLRDPGAWYHIVVALDTTQLTDSNRIKIYVNGTQQTLATTTYPSLNFQADVNNTNAHYIGQDGASGRYHNGYLTEVNFIDGLALDADYFGFTDANGIWQPKPYKGAYGTNGFYLPMTLSATATGFSTVTWEGTGSTNNITGVGFAPDFVWIKERTEVRDHVLFDAVRGSGKALFSNLTAAEDTDTASMLSAFNPDGFTVGASSYSNSNNQNYVAWCWDAGSSTVTNNDGTITSTVRASQANGFSVVTWTNASNGDATVGHGLGAAPKLIITKKRSTTNDWYTFTTAIDGSYDYLKLNATDAKVDSAKAAPTSTVFTTDMGDTSTAVAYCFSEISGFSKIGTYTGNGSATGPTVTTGFKPAFVMLKRTDAVAAWFMYDSTRDPVSPNGAYLQANTSNAEGDFPSVTFTDTGFQLVTTSVNMNASGGTYIYIAFADTRAFDPFDDYSGNGNNWQPNNIGTDDVFTDVPTNQGTDTGAGGEVRGNYATLNPLDNQGLTIANGNLDASYASAAFKTSRATISMTSGKWYFEALAKQTWNYGEFGVMPTSAVLPSSGYIGASGVNGYAYQTNGYLYNNDVSTNSGISTVSSGDIMMCAVDIDAGKIWFGKNGTWFNSGAPASGTNAAYTSLSGSYSPAVSIYSGSSGLTVNFGARAFSYTAPSGFKALCTQNLPTPTILDGADYFNATLWTGNGATQTITTGLANDLVWTKDRGAAYDHTLFDVIRTPGYFLRSNATSAEEYRADSLTAFTSTGFSVGADSVRQNINKSGNSYVSWAWKANGAGVTNTAGSINSTVSANTTAGFSIVTYTGTANSETVGHGLGVAPSMIIVKVRGTSGDWPIYHVSVGREYFLLLNSTSAVSGQVANYWGTSGIPSSTVFGIKGGGWSNNYNGYSHVAYCFAAVSGYSAFGSYVGSGSQPGTFTYLGFNPAFLLVKESDGIDGWGMYDDARNTYNPESYLLQAQDSGAESSAAANYIDFLSNGFRVCTGGSQGNFLNESGKTYIYAAFASNPFKLSRAR